MVQLIGREFSTLASPWAEKVPKRMWASACGGGGGRGMRVSGSWKSGGLIVDRRRRLVLGVRSRNNRSRRKEAELRKQGPLPLRMVVNAGYELKIAVIFFLFFFFLIFFIKKNVAPGARSGHQVHWWRARLNEKNLGRRR